MTPTHFKAKRKGSAQRSHSVGDPIRLSPRQSEITPATP